MIMKAPVQERKGNADSRQYGNGMRKVLPVSELREQVRIWKMLVVVNAAAFGLAAVTLLWTWSSTPDLARRNLALIDATFGLGLAGGIMKLLRYRRQLESRSPATNP